MAVLEDEGVGGIWPREAGSRWCEEKHHSVASTQLRERTLWLLPGSQQQEWFKTSRTFQERFGAKLERAAHVFDGTQHDDWRVLDARGKWWRFRGTRKRLDSRHENSGPRYEGRCKEYNEDEKPTERPAQTGRSSLRS